MTRSKILFTALAFAGSFTTLAFADGPPHHQPPQQAFDACKSKASGDACTVTFGDKTVDGTCKAHPEGATTLACHPAHMGPPPEAIAACTSKAANDACTVTFKDGKTMAGTCGTHGDNAVLACHGAHHGGPH
jgi:hypothetical protein